MPEPWQVLTFEAPLVVMLGPEWAAIMAGFAVMIYGHLHLTPSGERYLARRHP